MVTTIKAEADSANIEIEQGTTWDKTLTYKDPTGVAIDLTGYTARMSLKAAVTDTATLDSLTTGNSRIVLGGAAGTIQIIFSDAVTSAYTFTTALYDFELIDGSGNVSRLFKGKIIVIPEITT